MNKPTMPPSLTVEGATHEDWVNHYFRMADYWLALEKWHEARIAALEAAMRTIAAQSSGIPGSMTRADCIAAMANAALRNTSGIDCEHQRGSS